MRRKKGFSTLEYAGLIVAVSGALLVMQYFLKHAFSGHYKAAADTFGYGRQYDPASTTNTTTPP